MTQISYFDGRDSEIKGVYNKPFDTVFVNAYLDEIERKKVTYPEQYKRRREEYELQADRNMIHYLLKEELESIDDIANFNYIHFMEKYKLKTVTDELMVIDEYYELIG